MNIFTLLKFKTNGDGISKWASTGDFNQTGGGTVARAGSKILFLLLLMMTIYFNASAATFIKGKVVDADTKEPLISALRPFKRPDP